MQYNRARWYSPTLGRWLSQDPISFAAGDVNLYRYVGNGPTTKTDPSGLEDWIPPELRAYPGQVAQFWKGYFWDGPVNVVTGTASAVYNYDETWEGIKGAVADPAAAASAIGEEYYEKSQTAAGQGEICFDVATIFVGATKAAKAAKLKRLQKLSCDVDVDLPDVPQLSKPDLPARVDPNSAVDNVVPNTPVGRRTKIMSEPDPSPHRPQHVNSPHQPVQNRPGTVNGIDYSGHAFDQMRNRGVTPSVIENALRTGTRTPGNTPGTTVVTDAVNKVKVVINSQGRVITVE
ncbi:MAG: hypothetical protein KatS3mg111_0477 [Pirellulaceae bacterium]|nr:MAG: hypothetical protein KatS3mg111_0477 [Pirellulaceae bacterium]